MSDDFFYGSWYGPLRATITHLFAIIFKKNAQAEPHETQEKITKIIYLSCSVLIKIDQPNIFSNFVGYPDLSGSTT